MSTGMVTFTIDGSLLGIGVRDVQEVLHALPRTPVPSAPQPIAGLVNLRGQVLTVLDLREHLGARSVEDGADLELVVVRAGEDTLALLVDAVGSVVDVGPEQLVPPPPTLHGPARDLLHGAYPLEHALLLALDVHHVAAL